MMDSALLEKVVRQIVSEMEKNSMPETKSDKMGIFEDMNEAIEAAHKAQRQYMKCSLAERSKYIQAIRREIGKEGNIAKLSRMAVEETGMGNIGHKMLKNRLVVEKTPGIEDLATDAMTGDNGLTLVELSPFGVIGSVTPTTNPSETIICNAIGMLAAGNAVVFSPHPRAKNTSIHAIQLMNKALKEAGAPENLLVSIKSPSIETTNVMMAHQKVRMICATGGPALVNTVLKSGKKAIGAGAGNPPAVVDETADIEKAARDIVNGASFDNNLPCIAEKEVIAVDKIADYLIFNMKANGAYELPQQEILRLKELVINEKGGPKTDFVGKSAVYILDKLGIPVDESVRLIIFEADRNSVFVQEELMMPILPIVRVNDVDEAIDLAVEVEHGFRHTAMMHSKNVDKLTKMAKLIQTTIFVKNGPSYCGIGFNGEGYTTFTIAGPTGEGLTSAKSFARKRRCVLVDGFNIK